MRDGLATMCVANADGISASLIERCLLSACSARAWAGDAAPPIYAFVDDALPNAAATFLSEAVGALLIRVSSPVAWPSSERWPVPPKRAYSSNQLQNRHWVAGERRS